MDNSREEIPLWTWYTGNLLFKLSESLMNNPHQSLLEFYQEFQKDQEIDTHNFYQIKNQGTVMMLLYGLFVVPREIWENEITDFKFSSRSLFRIKTGDDKIKTSEFIRLLRNSLSHANFSVDSNSSIVAFWNINRKGDRNFEAEINYNDLGVFLTEIGKFYINDVKKN